MWGGASCDWETVPTGTWRKAVSSHSLPPREKVQNGNELRGRIVRTAQCVTIKMLSNTWRETEYCTDMCHATNGAHIEST